MLISKILKENFTKISRESMRSVSSLFLPRDKAKEQYSVLVPYMDFKEVFQKQDLMEENLNKRGISSNLKSIERKYKNYLEIESEKAAISSQREELARKLRKLNEKENSIEINKMKEQGQELREYLKLLKAKSYSIENDFIQDFLLLPNQLHSKTPIKDETIVYRKLLPSNGLATEAKSLRNHLEKKNLIDYRNESCYYLLNEAAEFEIDFTLECLQYFSENNFIQTVNPDFARNIILEAATESNENYHEILEENETAEKEIEKINRLHLVGGGSLLSFFSYVAKLAIYPNILPLKFITSGREYYQNLKEDSNVKCGLYEAMQTNTIQCFIVTENSCKSDEEFESILHLVVNILNNFDIHYKIIYLPANKLKLAESVAASIQIYSPHYSKYVEIGRVSNFDDFISKRILFNSRKGNTFSFPHIVGGTLINVTKLIAALVEHEKALKCPIISSGKKDMNSFKEIFI